MRGADDHLRRQIEREREERARLRGPSILFNLSAWACAIWAVIATVICAQRGAAPVMVPVSLWTAVLAASVIWGYLAYHRAGFRGAAMRPLGALIGALIGGGLLLAVLLLVYIWNDGNIYGA